MQFCKKAVNFYSMRCMEYFCCAIISTSAYIWMAGAIRSRRLTAARMADYTIPRGALHAIISHYSRTRDALHAHRRQKIRLFL